MTAQPLQAVPVEHAVGVASLLLQLAVAMHPELPFHGSEARSGADAHGADRALPGLGVERGLGVTDGLAQLRPGAVGHALALVLDGQNAGGVG